MKVKNTTEKIEYAKELLAKNPKIHQKTLSNMVKEKFKTGLSNSTTSKLKMIHKIPENIKKDIKNLIKYVKYIINDEGEKIKNSIVISSAANLEDKFN